MRLALALLSLLLAAPAAAAPKVGDTLPRLVLSGEDQGLMRRVGDDDAAYSRFDSKQHMAPGKVYIVSYLAGRLSAKDMGTQLKKAMRSLPPSAKLQPVNIMNLDDCAFGTCGFARGKFVDHLHEKPRVIHAVDEDGKGLKRWGAMEEGLAVWVIDHTGRITHMVRGEISPAAARGVVQAVDAALKAMP